MGQTGNVRNRGASRRSKEPAGKGGLHALNAQKQPDRFPPDLGHSRAAERVPEADWH
jgi:hypothetical protein